MNKDENDEISHRLGEAFLQGRLIQQPVMSGINYIPLQGITQDNFAVETNKLIHGPTSMHCCSLFGTIILVCTMTCVLVILLHPSPHGYHLTPASAAGIIIGAYIIYILIALPCNSLYEYLSNVEEGEHFQWVYERGRDMQGHFDLKAECYHYERTVYVHDRERGVFNTTYETRKDKVVTHTAEAKIVPIKTVDESGPIEQVNAQTNIIFVEFAVSHRFESPMSEASLNQQLEQFKANNRQDAYQDYTCIYVVPELTNKMAFYVGDLQCKMKSWLVVFACLGLVWPYSLWVESRISRFQIKYSKLLTIY